METTALIALVTTAGASIGTVGSLVWWLSSQFNSVRKLCYEIKDQVIQKLEYHERHDDKRFESLTKDIGLTKEILSKDIWEIRVRNARVDNNQEKLKKD